MLQCKIKRRFTIFVCCIKRRTLFNQELDNLSNGLSKAYRKSFLLLL